MKLRREPSNVAWRSAAIDLLRVDDDNPELVRAQVEVLSRQLPLLLFICLINSWALAWTHYSVAPGLLAIGYPALITLGYCVPAWTWIGASYRPPAHDEACKLLQHAVVQAPIATSISIAWALSLLRYGDSYAQGHVIFTIGITVTSCIFCQLHLRPAVLLVAFTTAVAFLGLALTTDRPVFVVISLSMLLALAAMVYIALIFWRDFTTKIEFQKELAASQRENLLLANIDMLTQLPNRRQFFAKLQDLLRLLGGGGSFVIGAIDLDGFKAVNDLYGHVAGDRLLAEAGRRLMKISDVGTFFARLGGDEFGVIAQMDVNDENVRSLGSRICEALQAPFELQDGGVTISSSVGLAIYPKAGLTEERLFECADYALYHAKRRNRGRAVVFSLEHEGEIREAAILELCLREADFDKEMSLHFQPIVEGPGERVIAFEALARWRSPKVGPVAPDVFIRIAERSEMMSRLTQTLLRKALASVSQWPEHIGVTFNLSARDLASGESVANIIAILAASGISPGRIDFEVTETALMQDVSQARDALQELKAFGVGIALDDFGTGYSSLGYIRQFPIDRIKIDRSFIKDVEADPSCRAILKSVVDLCKNLQITCVVEGVETSSQWEALIELGCTTFQGYFFGKPMPADEAARFIDARQPVAEPL